MRRGKNLRDMMETRIRAHKREAEMWREEAENLEDLASGLRIHAEDAQLLRPRGGLRRKTGLSTLMLLPPSSKEGKSEDVIT